MSDMQLLTVDNLRTMLMRDDVAQYIDLRDLPDFQSEHIAGFVNMPLLNFEQLRGRLRPELPVCLLCTNGKRARLAAEILEAEDFRDIRVIAGGILSWKVQCYPTIQKAS